LRGAYSTDRNDRTSVYMQNIQLSKLNFYGIHGKTGQWFKSYLHDRKEKNRKIKKITPTQTGEL
jgi:hypothetical protein